MADAYAIEVASSSRQDMPAWRAGRLLAHDFEGFLEIGRLVPVDGLHAAMLYPTEAAAVAAARGMLPVGVTARIVVVADVGRLGTVRRRADG